MLLISFNFILISIVCINVSQPKTIPSMANKKIISELRSIDELDGLEYRLAPKAKVKFTVGSSDTSLRSSRSKRDTLLNMYRQKELYKNLNKNLYQSYFQSSLDDIEKFNGIRSKMNVVDSTGSRNKVNTMGISRNDGRESSNTKFKKLDVNPYKNYKNARYGANPAIYKKHPGFKVTDSVNHLKYLVDNSDKAKSSENSIVVSPSLDKMEVLSKIMGDNNNISNVSRQRRGEFVHSKQDNALSEMDRLALEELQRDNLRN